jgi:hypothetical protein
MTRLECGALMTAKQNSLMLLSKGLADGKQAVGLS